MIIYKVLTVASVECQYRKLVRFHLFEKLTKSSAPASTKKPLLTFPFEWLELCAFLLDQHHKTIRFLFFRYLSLTNQHHKTTILHEKKTKVSCLSTPWTQIGPERRLGLARLSFPWNPLDCDCVLSCIVGKDKSNLWNGGTGAVISLILWRSYQIVPEKRWF